MHRVMENHIRINDFFTPHMQIAEPDEISRGKRRYYLNSKGSRRVYFITEGDFLLKMPPRHKILNIFSAPFVVGINPCLDIPPLYLERVDYGKVSYIDYDFFWETVLKKGLLNDTMKIMSQHYSDLMDYIMLSKKCTYDQVISLIERWQKLPPHLKRRFSVLFLIEHSSYMSKSSISRVLKDLKDRRKIVLDRGRLRPDDVFNR